MENRYLFKAKTCNGEWVSGFLHCKENRRYISNKECCGYIGWNEDEAGFYFNVLLEDGTYEEEHIYDYVDCMEIIGNTFDNMELLERSIE